EREGQADDRDVVGAEVGDDDVLAIRRDRWNERASLLVRIAGADEHAATLRTRRAGAREIDVDDRDGIAFEGDLLALAVRGDDVPAIRGRDDAPRADLGRDTGDLGCPVTGECAVEID